MPRPLPHSLAESAATPLTQASTGDVLRTLGGIGLPSTGDVERMSGISGMPEHETRWDTATTVLADTRELFGYIELIVPELADFAAAGVDFQCLQTAYKTMYGLDLEPQLVLAPVLSPAEWQSLFEGLQNDRHINIGGRIKNSGLFIKAAGLERNWDSLQGHQHSIRIGSNHWQVLVVPGTERANIMNVDHNGTDGTSQFPVSIGNQATQYVPAAQRNNTHMHPTIPAYLTLQANRLLNHEPPIDANIWTWLDGRFEGGSRSPAGLWDPINGLVMLDWGRVDGWNGSLGVRLPVWGNR